MNFSLFEDTIINYRMADNSSYYYLSYHVKADTEHEVNLYVHGCWLAMLCVTCTKDLCGAQPHVL